MKIKQTIFFLLTGLILFASAGWVVIFVIIDGDKILDYNAELNLMESNIAELNQSMEYFPIVKQNYFQELDYFDTLRTSISSRETYVQVLEEIRNIASTRDIQIISLSPDLTDSFPSIKDGLQRTRKHVERIPVSFLFRGEYVTIGKMLEALTKSKHHISIGALSLESHLESGNILSGEVVLYTYWFVEGETS
ncbi:MAG: hypothetical protein H8D46_04560 [FCB group bacterium]|nr:hypothetical protein [FCB group bacterium]